MSQDFADDSGKMWTPSDSDEQTVTEQYKFGAQSYRPHHNYISTPAHNDFGTGTGNFTWEFWIRKDYASGTFYITQQMDANDTYFELTITMGGEIDFLSYHDTGLILENQVNIRADSPFFTFSLNTWYHIAVERVGDDGYIFVDGVPQATDNLIDAGASIAKIESPLIMGWIAPNCWVDEVRFSNTNRYATGGFTPPAAAFTLDSNTKVLLHFEPIPIITGVSIQAYNY